MALSDGIWNQSYDLNSGPYASQADKLQTK
jgi:hypothetical protein